jgi:hypothetical protein
LQQTTQNPSLKQVTLTMPYDMMSLILAGLRLQHTTTRRFSIASLGTNFTNPLMTWQSFAGQFAGQDLDLIHGLRG